MMIYLLWLVGQCWPHTMNQGVCSLTLLEKNFEKKWCYFLGYLKE